ncbi:MAG: peptidyl-prolyl cis-trans isomerase [Verrucomicrobiota bacterium]
MRVSRFVFAVLLCTAGFAQAALVNGINAVVNDTVITYDEVERKIALIADGLFQQYRNQPQVLEERLKQLRADQMEELVERQLILNEFKTAGYKLPETFIDDAIREEIRKNFYGDSAKLTKTLQSEGMTKEAFRQQQRERIIVRYLSEQNISSQKILISPFKIEKYYTENQERFKVGDQVKLRMIVLNQASSAEPGRAKQLAQEVLKKIEEGAPFAEMASIYSEGAQRAEGGDRGWVDRDRTDLKKELADAAFALKAGQLSGVIDLPEGCYLMLVEEARPAHVRPLDELRADIESTLQAQESANLRKQWIERLRKKSFVRYY